MRERTQCSSGCGVLERAPVGGGGGVGGDSKNHTIHKKFSSSGQFSEENGAVHSVLMECCCCCCRVWSKNMEEISLACWGKVEILSRWSVGCSRSGVVRCCSENCIDLGLKGVFHGSALSEKKLRSHPANCWFIDELCESWEVVFQYLWLKGDSISDKFPETKVWLSKNLDWVFILISISI